MRVSVFLLMAYILSNVHVSKAIDLSYYLPQQENYSKSISTPETTLGYQVGDWHARPEQIEKYFYQLAKESPRVKIEIYAQSHEQRPLFLAYISSEENIKNLENIRTKHLKMEKDTNRPAVTWMGYSVHGNEASGSNASLLFAYHLAAAQDDNTLAQLDKQIIIIDPMLNPDGLARFAHWANMYKSKIPNADPNTKEHNESWPRGRTNHYWFDLNRDWLLLQHPESQGRIRMFHHWKPNVLTDFHEMGTNSTYFFQPGVPSRQNPLTPKENFDLTAKIATYHAKALDEIGSLYYSKESFDDFYYGKGSTYPDINGAIGILFEQASARGHIQESENGKVSFPFAIKNHLTTSFSTIKAVQEHRKPLLSYQRGFFRKTRVDANASKIRGYVFSSNDHYRIDEFSKILLQHKIDVFQLGKSLSINNQTFDIENSFIVPLRQEQASLITAIFEKRKEFLDNTFYDVSSWTLPLAFDLKYQTIERSDFSRDLVGSIYSVVQHNREKNEFETIDKGVVGLAFDWRNFSTAKLLSRLHKSGVMVRVITKPSSFVTTQGVKSLKRGDIVVPFTGDSDSSNSKESVEKILHEAMIGLSSKTLQLTSGLAKLGADIGSPSTQPLSIVKPLLIIGDGVNSYQAGEVWHLFDQRLEQQLTMMTSKEFSEIDSKKYTHLILVDGKYSFSDKIINKIEQWVQNGGILITQSKGSKWLSKQGWLSSEGRDLEPQINTKTSYANWDETQSEHYVGGAIVKTNIDTTHPLGYGLDDQELAVFKRGQFSFTEPKESFVSVARIDKKPLMAGYLSKENQNNLAGQTAVLIQKHGLGKLIAFSDDMNFRGFWLGTSRVFTNALYFSEIIKSRKKSVDNNSGDKKSNSKKAHN